MTRLGRSFRYCVAGSRSRHVGAVFSRRGRLVLIASKAARGRVRYVAATSEHHEERSAGREGSAIADELIDFGERNKWKARVLDASIDCAGQVRRDWSTYSAAYDEGAFPA